MNLMSSTTPLSYAAGLVRQYDRDRFLTTLFAPSAARERLLTLYAFNSEIARIRESVSEPILGQMRLQWWRDLLAGLEEGQLAPKGHPVAVPLAALITERSLSVSLLQTLLDGREQDMVEEPVETLDALVEYCHKSSATLSRVALECLGVTDEVTADAAEAVGVAWALIGIVRSVRHHALMGRTILPSQMTSDAELTVQDLQTPDCHERLSAQLRRIGHIANESLEKARSASGQIDLRGLPVLLPATLGSHYLKTIESHQYNVWHSSLQGQRPAVVRLFWNAWRKKF